MGWIEIIHLRSCGQAEIDSVRAAFQDLEEQKKPSTLSMIRLYRSLMVENDLGIFLFWNGAPPAGGKSPLGLRIAAAFSGLGSVHHIGWAQELARSALMEAQMNKGLSL